MPDGFSKKFMARFTTKQWDVLEGMAADLGMSVAALIRVAVDEMIHEAGLEA